MSILTESDFFDPIREPLAAYVQSNATEDFEQLVTAANRFPDMACALAALALLDRHTGTIVDAARLTLDPHVTPPVYYGEYADGVLSHRQSRAAADFDMHRRFKCGGILHAYFSENNTGGPELMSLVVVDPGISFDDGMPLPTIGNDVDVIGVRCLPDDVREACATWAGPIGAADAQVLGANRQFL